MSNNRSLAKFKTEMQKIQNLVRYNARETMVKVCEEIADNMRSAAPSDEGNLARSVRVIDITRETSGSSTLAVKIRGGGPLTTRRTAGGQFYDYAAAIEFGNERSKAQPFFYPTFRRYRAYSAAAVAETTKEALRGNREVIARRSSPQFGSSGQQGIVTGNKGG